MAKIKFKDLGLAEDFKTVEALAKSINSDNPANALNKVPPKGAIMNSQYADEKWGYQLPVGARHIKCQDAHIVLGSIPPVGLASDAGGQGLKSPTIDLVVGRNASARKGKGPKKGSVIDNNFATDAARIYISRSTNLDRYFGLDAAPGTAVEPWGSLQPKDKNQRSGIGIKADQVRVIGREGVRIVTGKALGVKGVGLFGDKNSMGGRIESAAPKIEFIAGNNYDGVQGIAKGEATRDSLRELHEILQDLWSATYNFITLQTSWDGVLGVTPIPHHAAGAAPKTMGNLTMVMSSLYSTRINLMLWRFNTLDPGFGGDNGYIVSRNVRSN
tara:strand:+ start:407 stop:1393 length:987 start_codon:yes stop_codon:yes gene_type:complete